MYPKWPLLFWMGSPLLWVTHAFLLCVKVPTDSAGCGQWSRTSQELHSGVHRGWVRGCPQGFGQDLRCVLEWQPASGGDRCLQQGQVGIHALFTLSLSASVLFFSSPSVFWPRSQQLWKWSFLAQMALSVCLLSVMSVIFFFFAYLWTWTRTLPCVRG